MSVTTITTIRWESTGPYDVAFTTRRGGVSPSPWESLNLSLEEGDDPENVLENRDLLLAELDLDGDRVAALGQRHGNRVLEAASGGGILDASVVHPEGDGLWTTEPGLPMLVLTGDCLPIAIGRKSLARPALVALHAGWRGLLDGVIEAGVGAVEAGRLTAVIGPGIGPCCYEVGEDVAGPFRARFGKGIVAKGKLDLWSAAEKALLEAGCEEVERVDLCTACNPELFFSHRRDGAPTGRQGMVARVT